MGYHNKLFITHSSLAYRVFTQSRYQYLLYYCYTFLRSILFQYCATNYRTKLRFFTLMPTISKCAHLVKFLQVICFYKSCRPLLSSFQMQQYHLVSAKWHSSPSYFNMVFSLNLYGHGLAVSVNLILAVVNTSILQSLFTL